MNKYKFGKTGFRYYALPLVGVGIAAALRYELGPILGESIPVVIFTAPVMLVALYGGFAPAMFATVLSGLLSNYLFIAPFYSFKLETMSSVVVLATFVLIGFLMSLFGQRMINLQDSQAEQAKKLKLLNEDLEQSDKAKDEFLALLAHELRNPLAGISTASELLKLIHVDRPEVTRASEIIRRQVKHMTKLVDDLLDVSRIAQGFVHIEKMDVCIQECIRNAAEQIRSSVGAKNQTLILDVPEEAVYVTGDAVRLTQVFSNLLTNANKYSPHDATIKAALHIEDNVVVVAVEDNGQGIDKDLLPKVFDLFVQAERDSGRGQGGLGIGLSLVKQIVELHNGDISAHSAGLKQGSSFFIRLPKSEESGTANGRGSLVETRRVANPLEVLIVEDDFDTADTKSKLLELFGYRTAIAVDGESALSLAARQSFDVVLIDIGLPDMDGRELCYRLKELHSLSRASFIALSGYGQASDIEQSKAVGFDFHLIKPVQIDALTAVLSTARHVVTSSRSSLDDLPPRVPSA